MKTARLAAIALAGVLGAAVASTALAHPRARASIGLYVGVPIGWPYWGPYVAPFPYYYPPYQERIVVVPSEPTVYVEQPRAAPAADAGYWYYCGGAGAYYPYVKECPGGWQRVAPRPPGE
ncbi:MAG: hypothetical protein A3I63_10375 [Betaproteobacteria bacterium RIFCSPLOWO2_02_FULL_66_14]|nr:MAG: hypothetical protein A3I63_10375 [Betaproteobacteria bacterium RIFCSPLOWO2_02_FULL_66_14]